MLPIAVEENVSASGASRDPDAVERLLAGLPLFAQVAAERVRAVAAQAQMVTARRGQALARRGERMPGVLVMSAGTAKLTLRGSRGEEKVVRFMGEGETFGEASVLLERPSPVDMVALADSAAAVIPADALLPLLDQDPRLARNALRLIASRFLGLLDELEAAVRSSAVQRLATYLDSLVPQAQGGKRPVVRLPVSKTALAARLGVTKETLSRLLRDLADRRVIAVLGSRIEIRNRQGLARLVSRP